MTWTPRWSPRTASRELEITPHEFAQNQIWCAIVALAVELTAWMQMLALTGHDARRWEPKRMGLRIFSIAGRLAHSGRRVHLRLS